MGVLVSKFRKKKSTYEVLEELEKDLLKLQKFKRDNQQRQKSFITKLMLYSIIMYIVASIVFYFYFFPNTWKYRLLYSSPLMVFPILIWLIRKFLHWFFIKRIAKNDLALASLKEKKEKILEEVMEKETYKKAKEILEKFDPQRFKELQTPTPSTPKLPSPGSDMRQRVNARMATIGSTGGPQQRPATPYPRTKTPYQRGQVMGHAVPRPYTTPNIPGQIRPRMLVTPQQAYGGPGLPRPLPPRERSKMDRVLEFLLGDGPQHKYALICQKCLSHNGMALKEEFEYISFRCAYCQYINQARKQRPSAPKLDFDIPKSAMKDSFSKKGIQGIKEEYLDSEETEESDTESLEEEEEETESTSKPEESTQEMHVTSTSIINDQVPEEIGDESMETDDIPSHTNLGKNDSSDQDDFHHVDPDGEDLKENT